MWRYIFLLTVLMGCSTVDKVDSNEKYLILKGANLSFSGEKSEALKMYEKALEINPGNIVALREKGIIEAQLENMDTAEIDLKKVLEIDSKDYIALRNLGYISFKKDKYLESLEYLKKIPNDVKIDQDLLIIGFIEYQNNNYEETLKNYELIKSDLIYSDSRYLESYLKSLEKVHKNSIQNSKLLAIEDRVKMNKSNTLVLFSFYKIALNKKESAEKIMKNYLTYNNLDKDILKNLEELYKETGDKEKELRVKNLILEIKN